MGAGTAISIWSLIAGIFLVVFGIMLCLTIIGIIIGIPMIIFGMKLIAGGAVVGGAVGAYKGHRRIKEDQHKDRMMEEDEENRKLRREVERLELELKRAKLKKMKRTNR